MRSMRPMRFMCSMRSMRSMRCCRDAGTLGEGELLAASLALASIDNVLLLGEDGLNDVAMRAGMGWRSSFSSKRWRWWV